MASMLDKLEPVIKRYHEIEESMGDPEIAADFGRVQVLARERASLENLVVIGEKYKAISEEIEDLESLIRDGSDTELVSMAKDEMAEAEEKLEEAYEASGSPLTHQAEDERQSNGENS